MINFQYSFRSINSNIKINDLNCKSKTLLVWQYCGIPNNQRNLTQPKALIAFRELVSESQFSTTIIYRRIPITCLGQIRLGSLCKDNRVIAYANFEKRTFQLNFHQNHWRFISFYASKLDHLEQPYPMGLYPLSYKYDRSWFLEFGVSNNYCKRLVIPSLELFTRCYGHSGELRRTLMTYPWNGSNGVISRLIPPINEPEDERVWKIKVGKRLNNGDTVFLAHLKYDSYTQTQAKLIYSQIEAGDSYNGLTFPKIGPWFEGPVQLTVRGIPFDSGQSFLGFQIQGISEPQGVDIIKIRDKEMMYGQGELSNNSQNIPIKTTSSQSDFLNITSDNDPNHGIHSIEIDDPEIIIIGNKRTIFNNYEVRASGSGTNLNYGSDSIDQFSTSEPYGSGKDTGQLLTNIPVVLESEGVLRDMWKAAKLLHKKYRSIVHSVHWYSPISGFIDSDEPELVSLEPFTEEEIISKNIKKSIQTWLYLDHRNSSQTRGLLIFRLLIENTQVYIVEIQRKKKQQQNKVTGEPIEGEESFCGMVFVVENEGDFIKWISGVKSNIRNVCGVFQKITKYCPGSAYTFKHSTTINDEVPCWSAIKNALKKVDITIDQHSG